MQRILFDIIVIAVAVTTAWYVYTTYGEQISTFLFGDQSNTIFIENLAVTVSVADTAIERRQGLSGFRELGELEGKLFIFDEPGIYTMWMPDMYLSLDIFWINENYRIVHIEENVTPESFPTKFASQSNARFVLETNAFFADSFKIKVGDSVTIPAGMLPTDLRKRLLEQENLQ